MHSQGDSYHIEINGIAEGPMSVRDLLWKIGTASSDDVILFRSEGSADWHPLEGNRERLQQLASAEPGSAAIPPSPPKLKLKKRGDAQTPAMSESPPPFPSEPPLPPASLETPPPPPGALNGPVSPEPFEYTDDNPPPPPGAPGYQPVPQALHATATPVPQLSTGTQATYSPPSAPPAPPVRISSILTAALVISAALAGYIFFLMPQDVTATAKRRTETSYTREVSGMPYAVLTKSQAEAWKKASMEKLAAFSSNAKSEAAASAGRSLSLSASTKEIIEKYTAAARALSLAGINAKNLGQGYDPKSSKDVKALRTLELAMEIAEAYLPPECKNDMQSGSFSAIALAVRGVGFKNLKSAYEAEILSTEDRIKAELAQIKPTSDAAKGLTRKTMYEVPADVSAEARGVSDSLGRFDLRLAPGDYYVISTANPIGDSPAIEWARAFKVKPLTENTLKLDDSNTGTKGEGSLWKTEETQAIERDIAAIVEQAARLNSAIGETQKLREDMDELKARVGRLLEN